MKEADERQVRIRELEETARSFREEAESARRSASRGHILAGLVRDVYERAQGGLPEEMLNFRLAESISEALGVARVFVLDFDPEKTCFRFRCVFGYSVDPESDIQLPAPFPEFCVYSAGPPDPFRDRLQEIVGLSSLLWIFRPQDRLALILGDIGEDGKERVAFAEEDREIAEVALTVLLDVFERNRAERDLRESEERIRTFSEQLRLLHDIGNHLSTLHTLDDLCREAVELGHQRLGFDRLSIWFYDRTQQHFVGSYGTDEEGNVRDERGIISKKWPDHVSDLVLTKKLRYAVQKGVEVHDTQKVVGIADRTAASLWDGSEVIGFVSADNLLTGRPMTDSRNEILALYASTLGHLCSRIRSEEEKRFLETQVREAQKLESLGVLAGGIAHDFNNLLMGILGNVDLALTEVSRESKLRGCLEDIGTAGKRAAELCCQMLAYSGKGRFIIEPLDLSGLMREMGHLLGITVSKKVCLRYELTENLPPIEGDATQIRQIVMNLVLNASEAIGDRSGYIFLRTGACFCDKEYLSRGYLKETTREGAYVYLEVADTGCGMSRETLDRIFEPFYTTKFTGRGLGLAAVIGIVRGHKGAIHIDSRSGQGSVFRILFPAMEVPVKVSEEPAGERGTRGSGMVLLVDDEETVRLVGQRMLEALGFRCLTAGNGREAVEVYTRHETEIDCVLLDMTMPEMDGKETFEALRTLRPDVRVVLSSGYSEQEIHERFAGKGPQVFIQKPYRLADLEDRMNQVFSI